MGTLVDHHISAVHQLVDIFTKFLPIQSFIDLQFKLGVDASSIQSLKGNVKHVKGVAKAPLSSDSLPIDKAKK